MKNMVGISNLLIIRIIISIFLLLFYSELVFFQKSRQKMDEIQNSRTSWIVLYLILHTVNKKFLQIIN
jgi:hypothetical protein